jgi:lipopolysaccharide transport protein LptA
VGIFLYESRRRCLLTAALLAAVAVGLFPKTARPGDAKVGSAAEGASPPITITADELVTDDIAKTAEFIGNVTVVRGEYTLKAERLTLYYKAAEQPSAPHGAGRANIRQIIAQGDVRLSSTELTATGAHGLYDASRRTIELSGDGSTIISGEKAVSGSKITIDLDTNRFEVSGGTENRVKAVFKVPEKNGRIGAGGIGR